MNEYYPAVSDRRQYPKDSASFEKPFTGVAEPSKHSNWIIYRIQLKLMI